MFFVRLKKKRQKQTIKIDKKCSVSKTNKQTEKRKRNKLRKITEFAFTIKT